MTTMEISCVNNPRNQPSSATRLEDTIVAAILLKRPYPAWMVGDAPKKKTMDLTWSRPIKK